MMTHNKSFKRRVRNRAARTGESYTAALQHVRKQQASSTRSRLLRVAVAQTSLLSDPRKPAGFADSGREVRRLMSSAQAAGARLIHFPEGTLCWPSKYVLSVSGEDNVGSSDWSRFDFEAQRSELEAIQRHSRDLGIWTVLGGVHELSRPNRPYNSLYVISSGGDVVGRYDERMLSNTKLSFMYSPGRIPVTFMVDGVRFGCALGMEVHFPDVFAEYETLGVDCVLFSTSGEIPSLAHPFAAAAMGHAAHNAFWVSYSAHAPQSTLAPSGMVSPDGQWIARCAEDGNPCFAFADIPIDEANLARPWRRKARSGLYEAHMVRNDPRSDARTAF